MWGPTQATDRVLADRCYPMLAVRRGSARPVSTRPLPPWAFCLPCLVTAPPRRPARRGRLAQLGQGMTEYVIVVALVAVAAIAVYQLFGQVVRAQTAAMARELAGENGTDASRNAQTAAAKAKSQVKEKTLKSFTNNAAAGAGR